MFKDAINRLPFQGLIQKIPWTTIGSVIEKVWLEAAGLSYASLFSLVPLVSLVVFLLQSILPADMVMPTIHTAVMNLTGETFDFDTQQKFLEIIRNGLNRFYEYQGTWVQLLSSLIIVFVSYGLVRRIQKASCRIFNIPRPPLKIQYWRATQSISWVILLLGILAIKILSKHTFTEGKHLFISFSLTVCQLVAISYFLKTFYPKHTSFKASALTTIIGYVGWKGLIVLLTFYASFSVGSRTVLGPWAIMPLFLMWLYAQFVFLFICLGILKELDRPLQYYFKRGKRKISRRSRSK